MKISTKGRYALRMLVDLAQNQNDGFVALKDVAKRQEISKKYLEQIVPLLVSNGFVRANKGYQGGYRLAEAADKITVAAVLGVTEGGLAPVACLEEKAETCPRRTFCPTLPVWSKLNVLICGYLNSVTVQTLLDQSASAADNYNI